EIVLQTRPVRLREGQRLVLNTDLDVAAHRVCYTHSNDHDSDADSFRTHPNRSVSTFLSPENGSSAFGRGRTEPGGGRLLLMPTWQQRVGEGQVWFVAQTRATTAWLQTEQPAGPVPVTILAATARIRSGPELFAFCPIHRTGPALHTSDPISRGRTTRRASDAQSVALGPLVAPEMTLVAPAAIEDRNSPNIFPSLEFDGNSWSDLDKDTQRPGRFNESRTCSGPSPGCSGIPTPVVSWFWAQQIVSGRLTINTPGFK
ncbi:hypothetical protein CCH79_00020391, partial [Gambusia affinis]